MSRRLLGTVAVILALFAASWWAAGQFLRWRDLQVQAEQLRGEITAQIAELRRLPRTPPSLPDPARAQEILASWTARLPASQLAVRTAPPSRSQSGLRWSASFETATYQEALDELDRLHALEPVAVTSVTIRRREGRLTVNMDGYVATSAAGREAAARP